MSIVTRSGKEGILIAQEKQPDLILLDLVLNQEDGLDILKQLKENPFTQDITVIIVTNLAKKIMEEKSKELGVKDFIVKSQVMPKGVVERVRRALGIE